jgi:hypothetical protein
MTMKPSFPLYIPSKGRSEYMITSKALTMMKVPHYIVVEPKEVDDYNKAIKHWDLNATVLELDMAYKEKYELCDDLGLSKSTGPGPARNFAWEHSKNNNANWHWVMDDNIRYFHRFNKNLQIKVTDGTCFKVMEDFVQRYKNIGMAGPNYMMFAPRKKRLTPFVLNTRIYSCNLIRNELKYRWRGRYNEDTILSLDIIKAGWCTTQFNAFLQEKMNTQVLKGGNTAEFYHAEGSVKEGERYADTGTLAKSQMQVKVHPDCSTLVKKYGRWHHHVDYNRFKKQKLIRRNDVEFKGTVKNYGMKMVKVK